MVMERRVLQNRWQSEAWDVIGVLAPYDDAGAPRPIVEQSGVSQWLYPGYRLQLYRDEAEGYYMNITAPEPRVFVLWRSEEGRAVPQFVTASVHEASGWMDSGEEVGSAAMMSPVLEWVAEFVRENYRPEPNRKRIRPQSFKRPSERGEG